MLFNSLQFLFFFIIVTGVYFAIPYNKRWLWLLLSSCYFYMAFVPVYIVILAFTIIVDYFSGIYIENTTGRRRKFFLVASLVANIGILVVFKYYNFLNDTITSLFNLSGSNIHLPYLNILLPIGLSFHTFQAMSYTIEVYRGNQKAERHFGIYALYVMFYPQLVAGPIERPQNLIHQFHKKYDFDYDRVTSGIKLMAWGLFKKVVIADRLKMFVDGVFYSPYNYNSLILMIATVFFAFQIFFDFSGYSDIARGAARCMGFELMINFNQPFTSKSITEFWRRWHISLSTWFNDYLFTPLVINWRDRGRLGVILALLITFFISGLWHGAGWGFIIYGVLHGIAVSFEVLTKKSRKKLSKKMPTLLYAGFSCLITFSFVSFAWIFFRSTDIREAFYIIKKICIGWSEMYTQYKHGSPLLEYVGMSRGYFVFSCCLIICFHSIIYIHHRVNLQTLLKRKPSYIRWLLYYIFIFVFLFFGVFEKNHFIYFQF
jgi:alginate O-acetyltransferase complex protein AlgI